eukprot:357650-Chlamydomonas_euryale.AAC.6
MAGPRGHGREARPIRTTCHARATMLAAATLVLLSIMQAAKPATANHAFYGESAAPVAARGA